MKRLHPNTIIYRVIVGAPNYLIPAYLIYSNQSRYEEKLFFILGLFALIFVIPVAVLNYYFFKYEINETEVTIKSGIFAKKQRVIPLSKIQNINIEQNFLQKILRITQLKLETAGDATSEAALQFISYKEALNIQDYIQAKKESIISKEPIDIIDGTTLEVVPAASINAVETTDEIFKLSNRELLRFGMLRFRPVVLLFMSWLYSFAQPFLFNNDSEEFDHIIDFFASLNGTELVFYLSVLVVAVIVTSWLADIVLTVNRYYKFSLRLAKGKLHTSFGFTSTKRGTIPLKRLQSLTLRTNVIKKYFDFYSLDIQTAGFGENSVKPEAVVPFSKKEKILKLIEDIFDFQLPDSLKGISPLSVRRAFIKLAFFHTVVLTSLVYFFGYYMFVIALFYPILYYYAHLRFVNRGYIISGDKLAVKQGVWFKSLTVIPIRKIQTFRIHQTIFQRRLGLATINVDTAAAGITGDISIIDIDLRDAARLNQDIKSKFFETL